MFNFEFLWYLFIICMPWKMSIVRERGVFLVLTIILIIFLVHIYTIAWCCRLLQQNIGVHWEHCVKLAHALGL